MALTSTVLGTTAKSIHTSSGNTVVTTMYLCNTGNVAVQFNIYAVPAGYAVTDSKLIYFQVPLTPHDTYVIDAEKLMLEHNDAIYANLVPATSTFIIGLGDSGWGYSGVRAAFWAPDRTEYIVVGDDGRIAISQTGESWAYQTGAMNLGWPIGVPANDVTKINQKRYVVVGNEGWMASSVDGSTWTGHTGISSTAWANNNINAVTNNGAIYVAVGDSGSVATSNDGMAWNVQPSLPATAWGNANVYTVIWNGNYFIIGGDGGRLAFSPDGVSWIYEGSLANDPAWGGATRLTTLVYSGSPITGYIALSRDNNKAAVSSGLSTWSYDAGLAAIASSAPGVANATFKSNYGFYAIGNQGEIYYRGIGGAWEKIDSLQVPPWNSLAGADIVWNPDRAEFIAVGAGARVATSGDGITWSYRTEAPAMIITIPDVVATVSSISI